jgi:NADH-quinone oxidoreductase subunit G
MDYDRKPSRFPVEEKVRKRKVVDLGPRVVLDQERCILCLRCTRFVDEVSKTHELGVFERGDRAFIDLAPGRRLTNPYSENVVDICPVGALTSKDFRFQARVWYLERTPSVCTFCANGCNIEVFHRQGRIYRFRPRYNPEVNDYWMCDFGRAGYKRIQGEGRLREPQRRETDEMRDVGWDAALEHVVSRLGEIRGAHGSSAIAGVVSAGATNEEAFLFRRLMVEALGSEIGGHAWSPPDAYADDFLIRADKNPNRRGLEALGISSDGAAVDTILRRATAGDVKALLVFGADLVGELGREKTEAALESVELLVVFDLKATETVLYADVLLPIASFAETDGTVTNERGRVQRLFQAFPPAGAAREGWDVVGELLHRSGGGARPRAAADVFAAIGGDTPAFSGMDYEGLADQGAPLAG